MVVALLKTVRPHQWFKNVFVAAPLVFSRRLDDPRAAVRTIIAIGCFCLLSSAVYRLNAVLAGATAVPVYPSGWLLLCSLLLAALLGFGKRAHELRVSGDKRATQRVVLERYRPEVLRGLLRVLAVLTIAAYAAYTQSRHALGFFGTRRLAFTVPFVAFGVVRFLWMTGRKLDAESPTDSMLRDVPFLVNLALYAATIVFVIYR